MKDLRIWFRNLVAAQSNSRRVQELEAHVQIVRSDYDAIISNFRTDHAAEIDDLQLSHSHELIRFGSCQGGGQDHARCLRPVRYRVKQKEGIEIVVCGVCFLVMKAAGQIETSEDLEPSKIPSFRRQAYKNVIDTK
jgi:hypothetical protein